MTATADKIPQATLREEWSASRMHHWARTLEPSAGPVRGNAGPGTPLPPGRSPRLADALLRLAADPRATAHERALAADRAAAMLRAQA